MAFPLGGLPGGWMMGRVLVVLVYACFPVVGWFMIAMMLNDWKMMDRNPATRGKVFG